MTRVVSIGNQLKIRAYAERDRYALVELWGKCDLVRAWNDPDHDIALVGASPNAEIFVGTCRDRLVSSVMAGHDGHRGWFYYLATDPDYQTRGFATEIVRHGEEWLRKQGVPKVQLLIRPENLGAKRFYQRAGYEPNTCHLMQRWLVESGAPRPVPDARDDGKLETSVTYLEMTEKPQLPTLLPLRDTKLAILRAEQPTVAFYRFLYNAVGGPWLWWERRALDDDSLAAIIHDPMVEIYLLLVDGVPAGYAELDRRTPPDIDLAYFGLTPEFIGRNLGRHLLTAAIDIAWTNKPERMTVNTNELDHPKAIALYQRYGFHPYKQEKRLFDDPRLNGLIPV